MKRISLVMTLLGLGLSIALQGQNFAGQYTLQTQPGGITLELQEAGQNYLQGTLTGNGTVFSLTGAVQGGMLSGTVGDELDGIVFLAQLNGTQLLLTMSEVDATGMPIAGTTQSLTFQRRPVSAGELKQDGSPEVVVINGQALTPGQVAELEGTYGVKPLPGEYWYDSRSGLYGAVGYPAYGYMLHGHPFGSLARDASAGNTGVFINGREIPLGEYTVWSYMVGTWIQPGAYWLDHNGNAGYEGNPMPVINLYVAAQQNAYRGQGGGGDNFWSSRFSAGNYDSGNTRGYVSVPGYGPVGYGFD